MKPPLPARDIPPVRKNLYYAGKAVGVAGILLFASNFLVVASAFNDPWSMRDSGGGFVYRALGGMALIVAGAAMVNVAVRGLAGSGVILDPQRARRDMEPWNRMGGGMIGDALDEIPGVREAVDRIGSGDRTVEVVRVRCPSCRSLNDEHDRFCGRCGKPL